MKTYTIVLMTAAFSVAVPLVRSAEPVLPGGVVVVVPGHTSFGIYQQLPPDYEGEYYLYNKEYYYGGRYETGKFSYEGRDYDSRYFHDGKYVYGGHFDHSKKHHKKDKK